MQSPCKARAWQCSLLIPALRLREEDHKFKASPGYKEQDRRHRDASKLCCDFSQDENLCWSPANGKGDPVSTCSCIKRLKRKRSKQMNKKSTEVSLCILTCIKCLYMLHTR
jgi:hypothetical protein